MEIQKEYRDTCIRDLNHEIQEKIQVELQHSLTARLSDQKKVHQIVINAGHYKISDLENEINIMYL